MIRMIQSSSANHAKAYFSDALQKSDYYLNDQELQGKFNGKLAERLNVKGMATKDAFFALCENVNPANGKPLTPRTRQERTTGYDINFHSPKSVSIVHALAGDTHIMEAFQQSVTQTMLDIEADSKTRVRKSNVYEDRETGELIWADFTHQTARPVDGFSPDPHLHSHCFVFNATWDDTEKKIKAGQFRDIKRDMPFYQARFHKILSDKLIDLGYQIRRTEKSFEITGVPQSAIDIFSKRTNEIGQFAKEKGITDARELSELGARTRSKKQKGLSMAELELEWRKQLKAYSTNEQEEINKTVRYAPKKEQDLIRSSGDCVNHAIKHTFERASVMADRRILATAYRHSIGSNSAKLNDITESFRNDGRILHVKDKYRTYCTTRAVLREKRLMVELARQGQGKFKPLYETAQKYQKLTGQQADAVTHLLTTPHQVSIIRGGAGTGKTTLMSESIPLMEKAGKNVMVVAPTAEASRGVLVQEGFTNAETVAKLLSSEELQKTLKNGVLWVDEAGLLGTKDTTDLLNLVKKQNARLILAGDTRQHASVVRGDALRILNTVGGINVAEVSLIWRQKDFHYKEAVEKLAEGNVLDGFTRLDNMGAIKTVDPSKPNEGLVDDYVATVKNGKTALIVSPTHKQGEAVTGELRTRLRSSGLLGKKEIEATRLSNLNLSEAEKSDWRSFEKGQVVQFNQNVPNIKRGSIWSVDTISENEVLLKNKDGEACKVPTDKSAAFDVYRQSKLNLSKGDKIKITKNSFDKEDKRLNNGQSMEVLAVNKSGKITLQNSTSKAKYVLDKDFGHFDHAYCTTSHSAQGKTVDEVFISQPASTFSATDAKQFYVSVSRGRDAVTIYTDDKTALLEHASEAGDRRSALELMEVLKVHEETVQQMERNELENKNLENTTLTQFKQQQLTREVGYEPEL